MQRIVRKTIELDPNQLTLDHIRTATIIYLPFHLCTGPLFQIIDPDDECFQIWLKNRVSIPHNEDIHEWITKGKFSFEKLSTDAMIFDSKPNISDEEFEAIKTGIIEGFSFASPRNPGFQFLNEIIAAHQMVRIGPYISGIGEQWPRILTEREFFQFCHVEVIFIADPDVIIDEKIVLNLFSELDHFCFSPTGGGVGDLHDYSTEQIADLNSSIRKLRNHAFYELKTNAISAMLYGNSIIAIVLGCAALEGAHGAFIRFVLRDQIPGKISEYNKFMNNLLRDQGFYSLIQLSVRILMEKNERPSEDDLKRCLKGVSIRNAIMHSSIKKTGKYKIRDFTQSQIDEGYSGIMAVFNAFEAAIESREKSNY